MSHITDHIPRRHHAAFFQSFRIGVVLPQMCIVIVALIIKAADTNAPAAVLVPAQGFHSAGLDSNDRYTDEPHHVMAQMPSFISVASSRPEIIIMSIIKSSRNGAITF